MRKEKLLSLLGMGLTICLVKPHLLYANPTFGGGSGTENDPYRLSVPEHLTELQVAVDGGNDFNGKYFILTDDIDFTGYDNDNDPSNGNFDPIGYSDPNSDYAAFSGNMNGKNHTISNLQIILPNQQGVGLFSCLENAEISNLNLKQVEIQGDAVVGGISGGAGLVIIKNSSVSGEVSGEYSVGGVVGSANILTIQNSSVSGEVSGVSCVGGLVGIAYDSIIKESSASGEVSGVSYVGGLVGAAYDSIIKESSASGEVSGGWEVGGLAGFVDASIIHQSFSTGDVSGEEYVGGLAGLVRESTIKESSASGEVSGGWELGGLAGGAMNSTIEQSFATGDVLGEDYVGGLIGFGKGVTLTESFSQGQVNGIETVGGLMGWGTQPLTITDCYSLSDVSGDLMVGGLVGVVEDSWLSGEIALIKNSYYDGVVNGVQMTGKLIGQVGYYDEYDGVWYDGTVSMENVYVNQEKNTNYSVIGDLTHGTIEKEGVVELTNNQMIQGMSQNHMIALDFENIWTTTSTTPMFRWQTDLVSASQGQIQVNGNVEPLIADVTIPSVSPDLVIDPNSPDGAISPEFEIQNDSNSPIRLELKTFEQTTSTFNDVLPDKYDSWEGLNRKESQDIALGLIAKEGDGWQRLTTPTSYVANHQAHELGIIKPASSVSFEFDVHHGRAFSESKTIQYKMVFVFDLLN